MPGIPTVQKPVFSFKNGKLKIDNAHRVTLSTLEDGTLQVQSEVLKGRFQTDEFKAVSELEINGTSSRDLLLIKSLPDSVQKVDIATLAGADRIYVKGGPKDIIINSGGQSGETSNEIRLQDNKSVILENVTSEKIPNLKYVKKDKKGIFIFEDIKPYFRGNGDYKFTPSDEGLKKGFKKAPKPGRYGIIA